MKRASRPSRTTTRWVLLLLAIFGIGLAAGGYVFGRLTPMSAAADPEPRTYRVQAGTLGRAINFPAVASWEVEGIVYAPAGGVVTEIVARSGPLKAGDIVLRLDERPIVLLAGPIPAFRDLAMGVRGRDVAALNRFLAGLGYRVRAGDPRYTSATRSAVKAWQKSLRLPATGIVRLGDVVFAEPTVLSSQPFRPASGVAVGAPINPGTPILERLGATPNIVIEFGGSPPEQVSVGLQGVATFPSGRQACVALSAIRIEEGRTVAEVSGAGGPLCAADACLGLVPASGETRITVEFTLVPEVTGPQLPAAAVQSDAGGQAFVELADGIRRPVEVVVASGGLVIVRGVEPGDVVILP